MQEFVVEDIRVVVGGEVAHVAAPLGDGIRHAADELLDGAFALLGAHDAVEIFGDHDVGGRLAPTLGDLDVLLLEDDLAFFVGDGGGAEFPLHFIEGVHALLGKVTLDLQAAVTGESVGPHEIGNCGLLLNRLGHASSFRIFNLFFPCGSVRNFRGRSRLTNSGAKEVLLRLTQS